MSVDPERIQAVFLAAEQESASTRAAVLDRLCGADAELRQRVETLLRAHDAPGSFLEPPDRGPTATIDEPVRECPGTVIGPYKLLQQIGEGGMGTVFMAEQTHPVQRKVALKVIKPGMDSRQVIARFEAERQALAMMDHVNIARVFDAGATEAGRPYFVMELVHGVPITKYCDDNHLTPRERLELFVPVCQAIQHAHQKGIIHRDIKPSNVMVTLYDGKPVPKVIDFGVAKAIEQRLTERTLFTQYGTMVGTPQYMSPEQAEMSALGADTRSDIYSLGVLLYELLTGSTPLSHKRLKEAAYGEVLRMIREEEAPKPSTRLSDSGEALASISVNRHMEPAKLTKLVRGELDWIVMKCLEKDRNRRYETANGFAMDLQRYLADEPVLACPPSVGYRLRKFAHRNKRPVLAAAAIFVLLVGGIIGTAWQAVRATRAQGLADAHAKDAKEKATLAQSEAKRANDKSAEADASARLAYQRAYNANMLLAGQAWRDSRMGRLRQILDDTRPEQTGGTDYRGFEWRYWDRRFHDDLLTIDVVGSVNQVAFSPDGTRLAISRDHSRLVVWDLLANAERFSLDNGRQDAVAFSPDGKTLATGDFEGNLQLWDAATGQLQHTLKAYKQRVTCVAFSPDGKWLASGGGVYHPDSGELLLWDIGKRTVHARIEGITTIVRSVAFSPDSKRLAATVKRSPIRVWQVADGREALRIDSGWYAKSVAFSSDGKLIAAASNNSVTLWDSHTGRQKATFETPHDPNEEINSLAFIPNSQFIVAGGADRTVHIRAVFENSLIPDERATYRGHAGAINAVAVSPDGRRVASASTDGTVKLWDAPRDNSWQAAYKDLAFEVLHGGLNIVEGANSTAHHSYAFTLDSRQLVWAESAEFSEGPKKGSTETRIDFWDLASRRWERTVRSSVEGLFHLAYDRRGRLLGLAGESAAESWQRKEVKALDLLNGEELLVAKRPNQVISSAVLSHDGSRLALVFADEREVEEGKQVFTLEVRELASKRVVFSLTSAAIPETGWALSPDGTCLAWIPEAPDGSELALQIVEVSRGGEVRSIPIRDLKGEWGDNQIHAISGDHLVPQRFLTFSDDGRRLAAAGLDEVVVWDFPSCRQLCVFRGHSGSRSSVQHVKLAISPDGSRAASCGQDNVLRLWDPATGHELLSGRFHFSLVYDLSFSPDGAWLVNGGGVLDARPWNDAERVGREARSVYQFYVAKPLELRDELMAAIRRDRTISEPVRRAALLDAERHEENAESLACAASEYAARPDATAAEYAIGLRHAEAACRREPNKAEHLAVMAACQYRVGQYQEALENFRRVERLGGRPSAFNSAARDLGLLLLPQPVPAPLLRLDYAEEDDLAFLAMTYHRLDRREGAQTTLARLRTIVAKEALFVDRRLHHAGDAHALMREAETLLTTPKTPKRDLK